MPGEIFVAKEGACISTPSGEIYIIAGKTTVRAGHPMHTNHPQLWEPLKVDFEVAQMPPPPKDPPKDPPKEPAKEADDEERQSRKPAVEEPPVIKSASPRTQGARPRSA
jgi:hypothetical protein